MQQAKRICAVILAILREWPRALSRFRADRAASVAIFFSLSLLPLLLCAGAGVDFLAISDLKNRMQAAADAGALRAAGELRLATSASYSMKPVAAAAALPMLPAQKPGDNFTITTKMIDNNTAVQVTVGFQYTPKIIKLVFNGTIPLTAKATARTTGFPICALGLDDTPLGVATIYLESKAQVTAQFCSIQSNAKSPWGITALASSKVTAGQICSAGGTLGVKANFNPSPHNDCPVVPDPLASRPAPAVAGCAHSNEVVDGGTVTLMPGTYCGGLKATNGAIVNLSPGEYVMKDGPLIVDGGATLNGQSAGVYLTGAKATIQFASASTIKMTAPTTGPLAGMLFFEDRASPKYQMHKLTSDNAPILLGTVYLPQGILMVDGNNSVGQQSAFTIILARRLMLMAGPNLVLNSDYASTNVPVPGGLTPGMAHLTQ